jgi:hypothetical protein
VCTLHRLLNFGILSKLRNHVKNINDGFHVMIHGSTVKESVSAWYELHSDTSILTRRSEFYVMPMHVLTLV